MTGCSLVDSYSEMSTTPSVKIVEGELTVEEPSNQPTTPSVKIVEGELTVEEPSNQPTQKVVGEITEETSSRLYDTQNPACICNEQLVADPALISDDLKCPLCLDLLKEPTLTSCCGKHFCQECIDNVKAATHVCPLCNEKGFNTFLDKQKQRTVNALKVYCRMRVRGCEWEGELGKLDRHLDVHGGDCQFVEVECEFGPAGCRDNILRKDVVKHQQECMQQHLRLMTRFSLKSIENFERRLCEQKTSFEQQLLQKDQEIRAVHNHLEQNNDKICQLELEGHKVADQLELKGEEIAHIQHQLELKDQEIADIQHQLELDNQESADTIEPDDIWPDSDLASSEPVKPTDDRDVAVHPSPAIQHITLKPPVKQVVPVVPVEVTMTYSDNYMRNAISWYSPPFYTHDGGYKLCLSTSFEYSDSPHPWANAMKIVVCLMHGESDDHLQFPFRACVEVEIVNHKTGQNIEEVITFDDGGDRIPAPLRRQRKRRPHHNASNVIPFFLLREECVVHDSLKFRVTNVELNI